MKALALLSLLTCQQAAADGPSCDDYHKRLASGDESPHSTLDLTCRYLDERSTMPTLKMADSWEAANGTSSPDAVRPAARQTLFSVNPSDGEFLLGDNVASFNSGDCCGPSDQNPSTPIRARASFARPYDSYSFMHSGSPLHGPCNCQAARKSCGLFSPGGCCSTNIAGFVQCADGEFCVYGATQNFCMKLADVSVLMPQFRVTKAHATAGYGTARISLVSPAGIPNAGITLPGSSSQTAWPYQQDFQHVWTQYRLSSMRIQVQSGGWTELEVSIGAKGGQTDKLRFYTPEVGSGAVGILIADPCINDGMGKLAFFCSWGQPGGRGKFNTLENIPRLLNAFIKGSSEQGNMESHIDYWGTLGDNWYDHSGPSNVDLAPVTNGYNLEQIYRRLDPAVLATYSLNVPGNHDLWDWGSPGSTLSTEGTCTGAWGTLQYYAQDVVGSTESSPYLWSPAPQGTGWGAVAPVENFNFYHQIGNIALVGFNGAPAQSGWLALEPFFQSMCTWAETYRPTSWNGRQSCSQLLVCDALATEQPGLKAIFLLSHWDYESAGDGSTPDTTAPGSYEKVRLMQGCKQFDEKKMLKFVAGHVHCNTNNLYGYTGVGFRVSGMGMDGEISNTPGNYPRLQCASGSAEQNFGIPIVDTHGDRLVIWYFNVGSATEEVSAIESRINALTTCVRSQGWRKCTDAFATKWLDEPLA